MPTVEFFFVPKVDLTKVCTKVKTRYARGHTVPGTHSYHVFIPKNVGILSLKRIGEDEEISGQHSFFQAKQTSIVPNIQDYVQSNPVNSIVNLPNYFMRLSRLCIYPKLV